MSILTYRNNVSNEQLLLLLLERAMRDEAAAIQAIAENDRPRWIGEIVHARSIYLELLSALDHSVAPEVTQNLRRTYTWALHQLSEACRTGESVTVQRVLEATASLYEGWMEAIASPRIGESMAASP